jgi:hypothetical protein
VTRRFEIIGQYLVQCVEKCTCGAGDPMHESQCGYEPLFDLDEFGVLVDSAETEWSSFCGGPDPDNAAMATLQQDEASAVEDAQWLVEGGVASRTVLRGAWTVRSRDSRDEWGADE